MAYDALYTNSTVGGSGNREGLTSQVADLFADEVPFFAMCEKVRTGSVKPEWQTDVLASAATTSVIEGAAISYSRPGTRTRKSNYTHIRLRNYDVTFSQMAADIAGIKDEFARQVMKALKALATDYDKIFLNTGTTAAGTSATGRKCMGIQKAISTNSAAGSAGASNAATSQLTEDAVNLVLQKIWNSGGSPRALFTGGHQKKVISKKFTAKTGFSWNVNASARVAIANVNKYEGSFGTVDIIPDRQHLVKRCTIVTPEQLKCFVLRDMASYKGAPTASSEKGWVEAELSFGWGNQKAHGKIYNCTATGAIA
jgi:hypothetical protein